MRDRQVFTTTRLSNHITLREYHRDDPFALYTITIPVGAAHCGDIFPNGTAHFYEHITFHRSQRYPERDSFTKWLASVGGNINAVTTDFYTTYGLQVPYSHSEEAWHGLLSLIFSPIFLEEDIVTERGIIKNERQQARWYPGSTEIGHYLWSEWFANNGLPKRQLYGTDEDLNLIDPDTLSNFAEKYLTPGIEIIVGGNYSSTTIRDTLINIETNDQKSSVSYTPLTWRNRLYHTATFNEIENPMYFIGSCYGLPPNNERIALAFLLKFLTNNYNGILYEWLREELGWTYGLDYNRNTKKYNEATIIEFPLQSPEQVDVVRNELPSRVSAALTKNDLLTAAVTQQIGQQTFFYQTLEQIIDDAIFDVMYYGEPLSEASYIEYLKLCSDTNYLQTIYNKYFAPENIGEFCALPKS